MKDFKLKITAGKLKSRLLSFDKNNLIRPTKSYIRELIFNVVKINKKTKCLDLFAGSGILSAEAYSRGASCIDMVELSPNTCNMIKSEFEKLRVSNTKLMTSTKQVNKNKGSVTQNSKPNMIVNENMS